MARHVFLVRHGESSWNAESRLQGQADAPLSELGRAQARTLRDALSALPELSVVTSDLSRARDTGVLAGHPAGEEDPRWRERGLGDWEGRLEADVPQGELRAFRRGDHLPPGGETWADLQSRVGRALDDLAAQGGSWLVFTHGGCVRAAVAHLTGADARAVAGPANVSLTLLELGRRPRLLAFNWTASDGDGARVPRASDPGGAEIDVSGGTGAHGGGAGGAASPHAES